MSAGRFVALAFLSLMAASTAHADSLASYPAPAPGGPELRAGGPGFAGCPAPDFDIATSHGWRRFSSFWRTSEAVLVFGADEASLSSLEREAARLVERDVAVFAVRRDSDGDNWNALTRLGLSYSLLSDPNGHVEALFGVEGAGGASWVFVDRRGIVQRFVANVSNGELAAGITSYASATPEVAEGSEGR